MSDLIVKANGKLLVENDDLKVPGNRQWVIETVPTTISGDNHVSIADIDGDIGVSYIRSGSGLRYSQKDTDTGVWTHHAVDSDAISATSLIDNGSGFPVIAYLVEISGNRSVKVAEYDGVSWSYTTVAAATSPDILDVNNDRFCALVNGEPAVVFKFTSAGTDTLRYWRSGSTEDISSGTNEGFFHSVYQIGSDAGVAFRKTNSDVVYADRGTSWTTQFIENVTGSGGYCSLHEVDGQPAIAYYRASPQRPKYARYNGTSWVIEDILPLPLGNQNVGQEISLTEYESDAAVIYLGSFGSPTWTNIRDGAWSELDDENQGGSSTCSITTVQDTLCFAHRSSGVRIGCLFEGCCCDWPF